MSQRCIRSHFGSRRRLSSVVSCSARSVVSCLLCGLGLCTLAPCFDAGRLPDDGRVGVGRLDVLGLRDVGRHRCCAPLQGAAGTFGLPESDGDTPRLDADGIPDSRGRDAFPGIRARTAAAAVRRLLPCVHGEEASRYLSRARLSRVWHSGRPCAAVAAKRRSHARLGLSRDLVI